MTHLVETNAIIMSSGLILNFPYISVEVRLSSVHDLITKLYRLMKLSSRTWIRVCHEDPQDLMIFSSLFPREIFLRFFWSPIALGSQKVKGGIFRPGNFSFSNISPRGSQSRKISTFNAWKQLIWPKGNFVIDLICNWDIYVQMQNIQQLTKWMVYHIWIKSKRFSLQI